MADGFARVSGNPGVCATTTGPGALNALAGIAAAYADGVPVVALTGQVPFRSFAKGGVQESTPFAIDVGQIYDHVTKFNAMVYNEQVFLRFLWQALKACLQPRKGPVHLNIPIDIQRQSVEFEDATAVSTLMSNLSSFSSSCLVQWPCEIAEALCQSERVVILAGSGVQEAGAKEALDKLASTLKIPVMTTPKAKGALSETHPMSLGVCGYAGHRQAEEFLAAGLDVVIAIGTCFNEYVTNGWHLKIEPAKLFLHVDIDSRQLGKIYRNSKVLNCDAKLFLTHLLTEVKNSSMFSEDVVARREALVTKFKQHTARIFQEEDLRKTSSPIHPARVVADLQSSIPDDSIIFLDAGNTRAWMIHYFIATKGMVFVNALGMAAMGQAVAGSIGGKLAAPDRPVFCVTGDGSFIMQGNEVATAVNYKIPVIWVVLNDSQFGMVYHGTKALGYPATCCKYKQIDCARYARSLGAQGYTIKEAGELNRDFIRKIIASRRPTVLNILIDPEVAPPILSRIRALKAGGMENA